MEIDIHSTNDAFIHLDRPGLGNPGNPPLELNDFFRCLIWLGLLPSVNFIAFGEM